MTNAEVIATYNNSDVKNVRKETKFVIFVSAILLIGIILNLVLVNVLPKNTVETMSIVDLALCIAFSSLIGYFIFLRERKSGKEQ